MHTHSLQHIHRYILTHTHTNREREKKRETQRISHTYTHYTHTYTHYNTYIGTYSHTHTHYTHIHSSTMAKRQSVRHLDRRTFGETNVQEVQLLIGRFQICFYSSSSINKRTNLIIINSLWLEGTRKNKISPPKIYNQHSVWNNSDIFMIGLIYLLISMPLMLQNSEHFLKILQISNYQMPQKQKC